METLRGTHRTSSPFGRAWTTLSVLLLGRAGHKSKLLSAQTVCGVTRTTPIRVENATGLATIQTAASCAGDGEVQADWAGNITLDSPIAVAEGTFLSVTGDDDLAVAHGDSPVGNGTRLFEVSSGGGLTLTQLKLSGGRATEGGAIYMEPASLTLDNCTFEGNAAPDGNGGAVWANGGNVTILGGEFLSNWATNYGGAIYAIEGTLVVERGARFEGNEAVVGGGLFCGLEEVGAEKPLVLCSITDAEFVSNANVRENNDNVEDFSYLDGGGAAAFLYAIVDITDSLFDGNKAHHAGGAVHSGDQTTVEVTGCTFVDNESEKYGGAISASVMTVGGDTQFINNEAAEDGGAVFGWDSLGAITFNNVTCSLNLALSGGGCFYGAGSNTFNDGTVMLGNQAYRGGCIYAYENSNVIVAGGEFTCESDGLGGFLYAGGGTRVNIIAGLFEGNVAGWKGGAGGDRIACGSIYCDGADGASDVLIEGGVFNNNEAQASGGAIALWGTDVLVTITGGAFFNKAAMHFGGFIYTEENASVVCEEATVMDNSAGDLGGGIFAQEAMWVNSSCDLISNEAPQGAAMYLTGVNAATLENHYVRDNLASGGSVVHATATTMVARDVRFSSNVGRQEYSFNRAVLLDGNTTLAAEGCVFDGWLGDTVIFSTNSANGSLVLDNCDFSESPAATVVISPNSDAEIRNAVVGSLTIENAIVNNSLVLVDRAMDCDDSNACGGGECVDSSLGVLCECVEDGDCLNDGGELSLSIKIPPALETFSPEAVIYELEVSSTMAGTTYTIWYLLVDGGDLDLNVFPSSGVLPPNGSATIHVSGTSMTQKNGGGAPSRFDLRSVGNVTSATASTQSLEVTQAFYMCSAFEYYEYAMPADGDDDGVPCKPCAAIEGEEGVDCTSPGATLASLPIREGYWRSSNESLVVHECLHTDACVGATEVSNSDDYCENGYKGPYCAVCAEGYGRSLSNACHDCNGTMARLLILACTVFSVLTILLLFLAAVFLVGGLDAINVIRHSMKNTSSTLQKIASTWRSVRENRYPERKHSDKGAILGSEDGTVAPVFDFTSDRKRYGGEGGTRDGMGSTLHLSERDRPVLKYPRPVGVDVGDITTGIGQSTVTGQHATSDEAVHSGRPIRLSSHADADRTMTQLDKNVEVEADDRGNSRCCRVDKKILRGSSSLPLNKLKIMVGVWQILAVFSSITGVDFPNSYSVFLSWINVLNFDLGYIVSASCVMPSVNFYQRLLATTLAPFALASGLVWTYRTAKKRAGIGSAGEAELRAAWSRHVTAGLLLSFLVFTSASSALLKTYACDDNAVDGERYLIADYSLSCETGWHTFFKVYAGLMILVYPIGIPVLYFFVLWKRRKLPNPRIYSRVTSESDGASEESMGTRFARENGTPSVILLTASNGQTKAYWSPQELKELDERVKARTGHPELVPFMFLWRDFGPNLYYYEVVECGRRIFSTEVLIFIAPQSAKQAAIACIFAFISLLTFEPLRPHVDKTDAWLYRLGCVMIFMSYFLALLIKMDAAGEENKAALGGFLVAVNMLLIFAVLCTSWFAMRHLGDDLHDKGNTPT